MNNSVISKPIVLILSSYDAAGWVISSDDQNVIDNAQINAVDALSYEYTRTTVSVSDNLTLLGKASVIDPYESRIVHLEGSNKRGIRS